MSTDYEIAMQIMNTIIPFGSYKGKRIGEMTRYNMKYYKNIPVYRRSLKHKQFWRALDCCTYSLKDQNGRRILQI
jgi:hypothetical protein